MTKQRRQHSAPKMSTIGWRETVGLPELGINAIGAKIDSGARTSALHAVDLEFYEHEGVPWVEFHVPLPGKPKWKRCAMRIVDDRPIKNTSGVAEHRYIVETTLVLGQRHWRIEVSLADRENMEFDLILGRTAIRGRRLLINPGNSFLAGPPCELFANVDLSPGDGLMRTLKQKKKNESYPVNPGNPGDGK